MNRLSKIGKYLKLNGFNLSYITTVTREQVGGRSFTNDGIELIDCYHIIKNGETFNLQVKVTGRCFYLLYNDDFWIGGSSQKTFIEEFILHIQTNDRRKEK